AIRFANCQRLDLLARRADDQNWPRVQRVVPHRKRTHSSRTGAPGRGCLHAAHSCLLRDGRNRRGAGLITSFMLWKKEQDVAAWVTRFTVGEDYRWDTLLLPYDIRGSRVQAWSLAQQGLLTSEELQQIDT